MRRARWTAPWKDSHTRPVVYHCISRVVDRRFAFGRDEKEKLRTLMRMYEGFTGCRALSYCFMSNHIHILLEVPPMARGGLSDAHLLQRLGSLYDAAFVAEVAAELQDARKLGLDFRIREIHQRFAYRMHDLSQFMKGFLQRYTQWHNRRHDRKGTLWEARFKSVIMQDGAAMRTIAAYIDLNPVRAGLVKEPAAYRWSSYGEAIGGGPKGSGSKARAGLVRALRAHTGATANPGSWARDASLEYRNILMSGAVERVRKRIGRSGIEVSEQLRKGITRAEADREQHRDIPYGRMLRCRIRYFTDGAVIGSREFVNQAFMASRERFGPRRKDGARKLRGNAAPAAGLLWSLRDLRAGIDGS